MATNLVAYPLSSGEPHFRGDILPTAPEAVIVDLSGMKRVLIGDRFESSYLSISVDIKEMRDGIAQTFHNIPQRGE